MNLLVIHFDSLDNIIDREIKKIDNGNMTTFGSYEMDLEKLNISFNPKQESELASYNFDDDGNALADKKYLIKDGILKRSYRKFFFCSKVGMIGIFL